MELILLQDVKKLGRKGELVRVKEGFGRNYLLPRNLGLVATAANQKFVADLQARAVKRIAVEKAKAETEAKQLEKLTITIEQAVGENEKLFGAVTSEDIRQALEDKKHVFDRKQIHLKEPIKALGVYSVSIEIYPQVKAAISVEVVPKS